MPFKSIKTLILTANSHTTQSSKVPLLLFPSTMLLMLPLTILAIVLSSLFFFFFFKKSTVNIATTINTGSSTVHVHVQPLPPSPPKLPIIGNLHQLGSSPHRSLQSLSERYGSLMLLHLGRLPVLVTSSPSIIREITQTQDHLFANRPSLKAPNTILYHGHDIAFAPYGEYWREMKKATILHLLSNKKDMFGAGTDPTSISMEWTMAELIRHPSAMKKLKEEITNVVGPNKECIKEDQLADMSYLKAVVKEALRLHPPGSIIVPRQLIQDTNIKGYRIPKGTMVLINAWATGRDPKIWDSPEEFRPERFINGEAEGINFSSHGFQLLAFGAGRRSCPGIKFSVTLIELAIANLVYVFDWKPAKGEIEDIDMSEVYGLTTRKREALMLIATKAVRY